LPAYIFDLNFKRVTIGRSDGGFHQLLVDGYPNAALAQLSGYNPDRSNLYGVSFLGYVAAETLVYAQYVNVCRGFFAGGRCIYISISARFDRCIAVATGNYTSEGGFRVIGSNVEIVNSIAIGCQVGFGISTNPPTNITIANCSSFYCYNGFKFFDNSSTTAGFKAVNLLAFLCMNGFYFDTFYDHYPNANNIRHCIGIGCYNLISSSSYIQINHSAASRYLYAYCRYALGSGSSPQCPPQEVGFPVFLPDFFSLLGEITRLVYLPTAARPDSPPASDPGLTNLPINQGNNNDAEGVADFFGFSRILGGTVDMGAVEFGGLAEADYETYHSTPPSVHLPAGCEESVRVSLVGGVQNTISVWVYRNTSTQPAPNIRLVSDGGEFSPVYATATASGEWEQLTLSVTPASDCQAMLFLASGGGEAWFGDFAVV